MQVRRAFLAQRRRAQSYPLILWLSVLLAALYFLPCRSVAQEAPGQESAEEIVANLCTGRVVIGIAKDGIVVGTLENPIESQTRPPMIVPLSDESVAVLLGAADWWLPEQHRELARLYAELPSLPAGGNSGSQPHLQGYSEGGAGSEATGVEHLADNLRARLAVIASHIHGDLNLGDGQPLLQMVVADYAPDYGPEVWLVQYFVEQEPEQGDYWQTRVLQPQYNQLWPPEKGKPRGLIEISDPAAPTMASMIRAGDARVAKSISSAPGMQEVSAAILDGGIEKLTAVDVAAFFRTCLGAVTVSNARMVEAEINKQRGVGWFIEPPVEKPSVGTEQVRPAGAPSLLHPSKPGGPGQR